ncbi:aminotransferase class I/II-fold pyridoxal phosphate-dependent enzyme [Tepidibacter hydrothermalis]|uniref:Aminotransferase class I/II-fold pyridoxal phosphate-dependent enzyme n=1 Tax=Tepidibacter hydrothermalis TaxID=3036126 RepID=A0ABY8EFS3_9FIRM|nr:aminotransferase class I/II-fold pyridoxal phosphate-dependent enzyme [Tepidibacter hydrothermalis]WFD10429.1 aminotransferase class I/II-fold pyridoxal phosphate-dependent enzyme [Tepidibacter hydrothermalis]
MNNTPIINKLNDMKNSEIISFHVPGHKNGKIFDRLGYSDFKKNIVNIDTTEIPGTDNLHSPEEIIKESQEIAAKVFKSDHTFFLVNGTTCGIQAAIMSVCSLKDKIIVNRDCHQSVINTCILGDIEPVYVNPHIDKSSGISLGVSLRDIEMLIEEDEDIKAVLITSPTYYGINTDIKSISEYLHKKNKILIVDEAHGSHIGLSERLGVSAIQQGADISIQSTHKTLPCFTQASMLHVNSNKIDINRLKSFLRIVQSSSPSYIMMSSIEMAVEIYKYHGKELMKELISNIDRTKDYINNLKNIYLYDYKGNDITKMYIITKNLNRSGYEIEDILRKKYNIQVELSNPYGVLLICSIGNDNYDFEKLIQALEYIDNEIGDEDLLEIDYPNHIPQKALNPREAFYSNKKRIPIKEGIGKICAEYIIPYPPGISLLSPGEIITEEIIDYIQKCKRIGMNITGIEDQNLDFIKIID